MQPSAHKDNREADCPPRDRAEGLIHVVAVIVMRGRRVLVARRNDTAEEVWEFPGGKVETGETVAECAVREIAEELDIEIEFIDVIERFPQRTDGRDLYFSFCRARYMQGRISLTVHSDVRWVSLHSARNLPMHRADRRIAARLSTVSDGDFFS